MSDCFQGGISSISVSITDANGVPSSATLNLSGLNTEQMQKVAHLLPRAVELKESIKKVVHGSGKSH